MSAEADVPAAHRPVEPLDDGRGRVLRVAAVLDDELIESWVALILEQILQAGFCELVLLFTRPPTSPRARLSKVREVASRLLFDLYCRVDEAVFGGPSDAFASVRVSDRFPSVPTAVLTAAGGGAAGAGAGGRVDVLLWLAGGRAPAPTPDAAMFGVWTFVHGEPGSYAGDPPFFWEMAEGEPATSSALVIHAGDARKVLYRSWSATDRVSLRRGRNLAFWKVSHFVIRRLRELHEHGWAFVMSLPEVEDVPPADSGRRTPSNGQMLGFLLRVGAGIVARHLRAALYREQWFIAHRRVDRPVLASAGHGGDRGDEPTTEARSDPEFNLILPSASCFYADPFTVRWKGSTYLFFEQYSWETRRGIIAYTPLDRDEPPAVALRRDYHLSYPFIFEWGGRLHMIPETSERRTVELYRADRVPDVWRLQRVLLDDITATDTTLFHDGERFWLFTCAAVPGGAVTDELSLFFAEALDGSWTPHPRNPVVSDVRRARPAGRILRNGDELIRPGQDCSRRYGSAVVFHRIDELTTTMYRETVIDRLGPDWLPRNLATHTYNFDGQREVIDGQRYVARMPLIGSRPSTRGPSSTPRGGGR